MQGCGLLSADAAGLFGLRCYAAVQGFKLEGKDSEKVVKPRSSFISICFEPPS